MIFVYFDDQFNFVYLNEQIRDNKNSFESSNQNEENFYAKSF